MEQVTKLLKTGKTRITSNLQAEQIQIALMQAGYSHAGGCTTPRLDIYGIAWFNDTKIYHTTTRRTVFVQYTPKAAPGLHYSVSAQPSNRKVKVMPGTERLCAAVNKALCYVSALGFNLSDSSTSIARVQRVKGWGLFCCCIKVLCPEFTVRGVSDALTVRNAPSRTTLGSMFENCWQIAEENPIMLRDKLKGQNEAA